MKFKNQQSQSMSGTWHDKFISSDHEDVPVMRLYNIAHLQR